MFDHSYWDGHSGERCYEVGSEQSGQDRPCQDNLLPLDPGGLFPMKRRFSCFNQCYSFLKINFCKMAFIFSSVVFASFTLFSQLVVFVGLVSTAGG